MNNYQNTAIKVKGPKHALKVREFYEKLSGQKFYTAATFKRGDFVGMWAGDKKWLFIVADLAQYEDVSEVELPDSKAKRKIKPKDLVRAYEDGYKDALNCIMKRCLFLKEGLKIIKDE